ncbi:hypothetical protein FVEG_11324 [Fusarium verticillioides 7600]|uniref:EKC/KEOPS complex subunit GON7 n=1 Tax=Gibberella moniliformis (strain M3125 / FGSC 7600) TaxID=334819 RepID=W7MNJ1_GIBM7|nr:hypothetical protein FVEG_11324 [Fusarium verticillioides 7600]EWG52636.1 hypothetical protein FVEG_11324 [Fusarium verticillioides 7600]
MSQPTLTTDYTSPASEPFKVAHTLPAISSPTSTADKSSYLKALRASDKARDAAAEAKEEENYGEEVQEGEE